MQVRPCRSGMYACGCLVHIHEGRAGPHCDLVRAAHLPVLLALAEQVVQTNAISMVPLGLGPIPGGPGAQRVRVPP